MRKSTLYAAFGLIAVVGLGLAACETIKPVVEYDSDLALNAPITVVRGGNSFTFTTTLTYRDDSGEILPLSNQKVFLEGIDFGLSAEFTTDGNGVVHVEVVAPMLPEREMERDSWIRAFFGGTVIEFPASIGRFSDANNSRYFNIQQQTPGVDNPGIPGAE